MAGKIKVPSELVPSQSNKIMLRSKYIYDDIKEHTQEEVNQALEEKIESKVIEAGGVNWDTVPTAGSNNAVKSKDIKAALEKVTGYFVLDSNVAEATVVKTVTVADFPTLAIGGSIKIKMLTKNTAANPTLRIGSANATAYPLYYNEERASADNSWEANEIISVFFDGTNYRASNSQGSGKTDSQLDENSTLPLQNKVVTQSVIVKDNPLVLLLDNATFCAISGNKWIYNTSQSTQTCNILPVQEGDVFIIRGRNDSTNSVYAWLTTDSHIENATPDYLEGYTSTMQIPYGVETTLVVPEGAKYIYIGRIVNGSARFPSQIIPAKKVSKLSSITSPYVIDEVRLLDVGTAYSLGEKVKAPNGEILRIITAIDRATYKEPLQEGRLMAWMLGSDTDKKTIRVVSGIEPYNPDNTYIEGDYAFGDPDGATTICKFDGEVWSAAVMQDMYDDEIIEEVDIDWLIENATEQENATNDIRQRTSFVKNYNFIPQAKDVSVVQSNRVSVEIVTNGAKWTVSINSSSAGARFNLLLPYIGCDKFIVCFDYVSTIGTTINIWEADKPATINGNNIVPLNPKTSPYNIEKGSGSMQMYFNARLNFSYLQFNVTDSITKNQYLQITNIHLIGYNSIKDEITKEVEGSYAIGDVIDMAKYTALPCVINGTGVWYKTSEFHRHILVPAYNATHMRVSAGESDTSYAFLVNSECEIGEQPNYVLNTARGSIDAGETEDIVIPNNTRWILFNATGGTGVNFLPSNVVITAINTTYSPLQVSHIKDIDVNTDKITALLGKYDATDGDMNLQILKVGRESGASCYWWYPHIMSTRFPYKRIYHTFCDAQGGTGVACINAFDHRAHKVILKRMLYNGVDLHNSASIAALPDGRLICVYSEGHNQTPYIQIRISKRADDITEWDDAISVNVGSNTCYSQFHYIYGKYYIFSRTNSGASWGYTVSEDLVHWTHHTLIEQQSGVSQYFYIWLKPIADEPNMLRFISYGHPIRQDTGIRCGVIDFENDAVYNYVDMSQSLGTLEDIYTNTDFTELIEHSDTNSDGTQRMYDLAITNLNELRILYGRQKTQTDGKYFIYESVNHATGTRTELCQSGLTFLNHSNTLAPNGICFIDKDNIMIGRSSQDFIGYDYLEIYSKEDDAWVKSKDVYKELKGAECLRNAYPIASPDGRYVMWMRGYVALDSFMNTKVDLIVYDVDNDSIF